MATAAPQTTPASASALNTLASNLTPNYMPARLPSGTVLGVWGAVIIRTLEGEVRPLKVGDVIRKGDVILTAQDGIVEISAEGSALARAPVAETVLALEGTDLNKLPEPAQFEGDSGSLIAVDQVTRIVETTTGVSYSFDAPVTPNAVVEVPAAVNPALRLPTLNVAAASTLESAGFAVFTVGLSGTANSDTVLALNLTNGTATGFGADFGSADADNLQVSLDDGATWSNASSVTLPAGQTLALVRTPLINDALNEDGETFILTATTTAGNTLNASATGLATITDDDALPAVSINSVNVNETDGTATFTVTLSAPSGREVRVSYATDDSGAAGQATANSDYTPASGVLTFTPGTTTSTITIVLRDDALFEGTEALRVRLSNPVNATVTTDTGVATIADNEQAPTVTAVEPGDAGAAGNTVPEGTPLVFNVTLSNASATATTLAFSLGNAAAGAGLASATDFGAPTFSNGVTLNADGTLNVPAGVSAFAVTVPTLVDALYEGGTVETLPLTVGGVTATGGITDTTPAPTVTAVEPGDVGAADNTVPEGTPLVFNVTLSNASATATTLTFSLGNATAGAGLASAADFGAPTFSNGVTLNADGTLNVPAGVSAFAVTVPTLVDALYEGGTVETLPLTVGGVTATGGITDTTPVPTVTAVEPGDAGAAGNTVPEGTPLVFNVTLSNASATATTLAFSLGNATAGAGLASAADFGVPTFSNGVTLNADGTLNVPAGVSAFAVTVPTLVDALYEGGTVETLPLTVGGVTATGGITDTTLAPEIATLTFNGTGESVTEGTGTAATLGFSVTLTSAASTPQTFAFALSGAGANPANLATDIAAPVFSPDSGVSYDATTGLITVPAGVTGFSFTIATVADAVAESDEALGVSVGALSRVVTLVNDDFAPVVPAVATSTAEDTALNGNVLATASDANGDPLTVTGFTVGGNPGTLGTPLLLVGVGTFTLGADGAYSFLPAANYFGPVPAVSYTVSDGANPAVTGTLSLTVTPVNDAPTLTAATTQLSEEGLARGLADNLASAGAQDTTDANIVRGQLTFADVDGTDTVTVSRLIAPTGLTSDGLPLTWTLSADGLTLIGTRASAGETAVEVLRVEATRTGAYTVTLSLPIDHAGAGEDARDVSFGVEVSDGTLTAVSTLTASVEDDAPLPVPSMNTSVNLQNTNLMIIMDVSGSMAWSVDTGLPAAPGETIVSRMEVAKASIKNLIDSYDSYGNVMVRLVTFSTNAAESAPVWLNVTDAKAAIDALQPLGNTNYDAALNTARTAFTDAGRLADGKNISFFFSDGLPTEPAGSFGINAAEASVWHDFLNAYGMQSYAIGLGTGLSTAELAPIATIGTMPTLVASVNSLNATLEAIVPKASGSLLSGNVLTNAGADGSFTAIKTITIDGIVYEHQRATDTIAAYRAADQQAVTGAPSSFDAATNVLTVTTQAGGVFEINLDAATYRFKTATNPTTDSVETLGYAIVDRDGDMQSATLTINVAPPASAPPATFAGDELANVYAGAAGNDVVLGLQGNDSLAGGLGNDLLIGGLGNDLLAGGAGSDVFAWTLADRGAAAVDTITDFDAAAASAGGDILDLRDLLSGEHSGLLSTSATRNLENYLDFSYDASGTTISIASSGTGSADQTILLAGVDLRTALGLGSTAMETAVITELLNRGKLVVDGT